jgi:flavin-dependent dehydrogenase
VAIGAGPAGAAAAYLLAKRGWRTLLLERSTWPRAKVCGGCLSASAVTCLREIGLSGVLRNATPVDAGVLHHAGVSARLPIVDSYAIRRDQFDRLLVDAFERQGGVFLSEASAAVDPAPTLEATRAVRVQAGADELLVRARAVLACDGLGGSSLSREPWADWTIAPDAYMGVAATVDADRLVIEPGEIHMHIGAGGYVGAVRYSEGDIHLAAALDPHTVRGSAGPASLIESILHSCGRCVAMRDLRLRGAPTLTRSRQRLGGHRVLAVGDACGYVEPFTGEGIAWALRSAIDVSSLLHAGWDDNLPRRWRELHDHSLAAKQRLCRAIRFAVRRPLLAGSAVSLLRFAPALSTLVTRADGVTG